MRRDNILTALCVLLLLGGCSKGVREHDQGRVPLTLNAGSLEVVSRTGILDGVTFFPVGESIGVYVANYDAGTTMSWSGAGFVAQNAEGTLGTPSGGLQPITLISTLYYKPGRLHDIFAYYPYSATGISYDAVTGEPILTAALTSSDQSDVITAAPVTGVTAFSAVTAAPNLSCYHRLSLMRFSMKKDDAISETLTLTKIEFTTDMSQTVAVNVATGTVSSVAGGVTGYEHSPSGGYVITTTAEQLCKFLFCPGTTITGISLTIDGEVYTTPAGWAGITVSAAQEASNVIITIRPTEIIILLGQAEWIDGGSINVANHTVHSTILLGDAGWSDSGSSVTIGK